MQQIQRRTPMPKCNFSKAQHGYSPVNLLHIFRTPFPKNNSEGLLLNLLQNFNPICICKRNHIPCFLVLFQVFKKYFTQYLILLRDAFAGNNVFMGNMSQRLYDDITFLVRGLLVVLESGQPNNTKNLGKPLQWSVLL